MNEEVRWPLRPADARTFTGAAASALLGAAKGEAPVKVYYVRFAPGARTAWHAHSGTQILVVCQGRCRYQRQGEPVGEIAEGESVRFAPGERHWHGGAPDTHAEHLAINLDSPETAWLGPVSDGEYADGGPETRAGTDRGGSPPERA